MEKKYKKSLFIFRRDLRLADNTGLIATLSQSEQVIPCFIIDPKQISATNTYRSLPAMHFMAESLEDLHKQLHIQGARLYFFKGVPATMVKQLISSEKIDAVFVNRDYTPYSKTRDQELAYICSQHNVDFISHHDLLLTEPEELRTQTNTPYSIFTPFYKKAQQIKVRIPEHTKEKNYLTSSIAHTVSSTELTKLIPINLSLAVKGGRSEADQLIQRLKHLKDYVHTHNYPSIDTSLLSAHIKFGTYSIREIYYAITKELGSHHPLLRQLYWRDFFTHVAFNFPQVFGSAFHEQYNSMSWSTNRDHFERWCSGTTGFPLVDAGMRQLNQTGFMHNRVRMITASFLVKDLHIDWRLGEHYFAQQLTDYDPAVNNGNWQWAASTGCDAQPYFRIFNPWIGQKKFDADCIYIKTWIPELRSYTSQQIHTWYKQTALHGSYPAPLVDHAQESAYAKELYKKAARKK